MLKNFNHDSHNNRNGFFFLGVLGCGYHDSNNFKKQKNTGEEEALTSLDIFLNYQRFATKAHQSSC